MKKFLCLVAAVAAMTGCALFEDIKSITDGEDPDFNEYKGMNVNEETPTGKAFALPAGIEASLVGCEGDVDGLLGEVSDDARGSGFLVIVELTLSNGNDSECEVVFPEGLVFVSASGDYQNGILVKETSISVPAGGERICKLHLYCLNSGRGASTSGGDFGIGVITDVEAFKPLFDVCRTKQVNIEEYKAGQYIKYYTIGTRIQEIVWAITKGKIFSTSEIADYLKKAKDL
ncbi:MAG: hypothetical protein MJY56_03090 [Bacteroidales bacterium]|nr:hypothetical protein [Bacteroidales bacterium]